MGVLPINFPKKLKVSKGCSMIAAIPTKLGSKADAGRSKAQHVLILAVCSPIVGTTRSARTDDALNPRLGGRTGLNDGIIDDSLTGGISNGKCRLTT